VITCAPVLRTPAVAIALASAATGTAHANPAGLVPVAGSPAITDQVHVDVDVDYTIDRAQITRELIGDPDTDQLGPIPQHRDLQFRQVRQVVTPEPEVVYYEPGYRTRYVYSDPVDNFWVPLTLGIGLGWATSWHGGHGHYYHGHGGWRR